jgi:hypothetical protein
MKDESEAKLLPLILQSFALPSSFIDAMSY